MRASARDIVVRVAWPALTILGALTPIAVVVASGRTLSWRDTATLLHPMRGLVEEALRDVRLPLWNPHEAFGVPLFAQLVHGVLHPASLAAALFAPGAAADLLIALHTALAASGAWLLSRTVGASRSAASVGGLAYGLSGYVLGMSSNLTFLGAAGTAPWAIAAMRAAGRRAGMHWAWAAVAIAALHFAGDPQWTTIAILLGATLALDAGGGRGLLRATFGVASGTALAAVQLVASWSYLGLTERAAGLDELDRAMWALAPARLVELVAPGFFGRVGRLRWPVFEWLGGPRSIDVDMPFLPSVFVGAAVIALAIAGARSCRATRILGVAAVVLAWAALGPTLGADVVLGRIPIWSSFRYAEKLVGPLTLCLAVLAAKGSDRVAERQEGFGRVAVGAGALCAIAAGGLFASPGVGTFVTSEAGRLAVAEASANLATGLAHAAAALLALALATRSVPRIPFAPFAACVVFLQSAAATPFALHAGDRAARDRTPLVSLRASSELVRIENPLEGGLIHVAQIFDDVDLLEAAQSRMGRPAFNVAGRIDQVSTYSGLRPRRLLELERALGDERWVTYRRYGVTHAVVRHPNTQEELAAARAATIGASSVLRDDTWRYIVWKVPGRGWASFAERVRLSASEEGALEALVELGRTGDAGTVVLEAPFKASGGSGSIVSVDRRPEYVRVVAEGEGLLVVNDAWWPGWTATLDGASVPIARADYLVRAVAWPRGRHALEMRYEPPEVRTGWIVSLVGAATLVLTGVVAAVSRRRAR